MEYFDSIKFCTSVGVLNALLSARQEAIVKIRFLGYTVGTVSNTTISCVCLLGGISHMILFIRHLYKINISRLGCGVRRSVKSNNMYYRRWCDIVRCTVCIIHVGFGVIFRTVVEA